MKPTILLLLLLISSTAFGDAQFVRTGPKIDRPQTDYTTLEVYYDPKDIEYPYKEIGRIFVEGNLSATKQIYQIRDRAAYFGAHAVIILGTMETNSSGEAYGKIASYDSKTAQRFTGIAIIKKPEVTARQALPDPVPVKTAGSAVSAPVLVPSVQAPAPKNHDYQRDLLTK